MGRDRELELGREIDGERERESENPPGFLKHRMQAPFGEAALGGNANSTARASANVKRP